MYIFFLQKLTLETIDHLYIIFFGVYNLLSILDFSFAFFLNNNLIIIIDDNSPLSFNHAPFHIIKGFGEHSNNRNTNHISDWLKYWSSCLFCVLLYFILDCLKSLYILYFQEDWNNSIDWITVNLPISAPIKSKILNRHLPVINAPLRQGAY